METFMKIISIAFIAIFIENTIFARALGTSTMIIAAKNKKQLIGFGICITYISCTASILTYFADKYLLDYELSYLYMPILYVVIIGVIYIVTLLILWKFAYKIFISMKKFVHISAFNCAVLGALLINSKVSHTLLEYIGFGLGTGIGFMIATYFLSTVYTKLYSDDVPESFRGFPLVMVYIGILSMAFYGLVGHQLAL
ncbi:MAG: Rnf-Nqr domain containing protein [Oscillospiraceae bacterium]